MHFLRRFILIVFLFLAGFARGSWTLDSDVTWSTFPNETYVSSGTQIGTSGWDEFNNSALGVTTATDFVFQTGFGFFAPYQTLRTEQNQDQRCVVYYDNPAGNNLGSNLFGTGVLLRNIGSNWYNVQIWGTNQLVICVGEYDPNNIAGHGATVPIASGTLATGNLDPTHQYTLDCQAVGINPTTLSATLTDVTAGSIAVISINGTDSTTGLQVGTGVIGLYQQDQSSSGLNSALEYSFVSRVQTYHAAPGIIEGTLSLGSVNSPSVTLNYTGTSNGTAPYTLSVYRSTTAGFTPAGGNQIATGLSDSSFPYTDSSAPLTTNLYYKVGIVDAASNTATTNQQPVGARASAITILFVGDSITFGPFDSGNANAPPGRTAVILQTLRTAKAVTAINSGVSGTTVEDWIGSGSQVGTLNTAISTALTAGAQYCHLMIGTNDARDSTATASATYLTNLQTLCTYIVNAGLKVIVSEIIYATPPGLSNDWDEAASARLQQYNAGIPAICNGSTILLGDTVAYGIFAENPALTADGIHPTNTGTLGEQVLAGCWAAAIDRDLNPSGNTNPLIPGFIAPP